MSRLHGPAREDLPKPALVTVFERIAAVMDLGEGLTRLELEFEEGHLRRWNTHDERNGHEALRRYEARATALGGSS
jgi:hypothetical protein